MHRLNNIERSTAPKYRSMIVAANAPTPKKGVKRIDNGDKHILKSFEQIITVIEFRSVVPGAILVQMMFRFSFTIKPTTRV